MKKLLRFWWSGKNRKAQIGFNLLIVLAAGFLLWTFYGYPLPTPELEFRRLERQNLAPKSEIVWRWDGEPNTIFVGQTETSWTAGYLCSANRANFRLESGLLETGPSPVPLTELIEGRDEMGKPVAGNAMLFLNVPEEAVRAVVCVTGRGDLAVIQHGGVGRTETFEGECQENGVVYVWMGWPMDSYGNPAPLYAKGVAGLPYTLELYRADGSLLLKQEGTIPGAMPKA